MDFSSDREFNDWWQETAAAKVLRAKRIPGHPKTIAWQEYLESIGYPKRTTDVPVSQREEFVATYALIFE